ncbi:MAG: sugar ABC transporter permease [Clostridiales bacterium]|nr:sugar ABC transporter permease [Clostridiales bacterium]
MNLNRIYSKWLAMPAFLVFFILFLMPSIIGMYTSFTNWNAMSEDMRFIGLANYSKIFGDSAVIRAFGNNIFYAALTSLFKGIFGLLLALALNRALKTRNILRTIFFLPMIISNLIVGLVFQQVFHPAHGILNEFLRLIGLGSLARGWIIEPGLVMWSSVAIEVWKAAGFNMVIFLAGLQSVPAEMYEACDIDGGNAWKKFVNVTVPFILPSIVINMLLNVISGLKVFDVIFALTNGGPGRSSEVISITIFNEFSYGNYGYATALNTLLFLALSLISIGVIRFYMRKGERVME